MSWEDILKDHLVDTLEFIKSSKDKLALQGVEYIKELLLWEFVESATWAVVSFLFMLVPVYGLFYFNAAIDVARKSDSFYRNDPDKYYFGLALCSVSIVISGFFVISHALDAVRIKIAPKTIVMDRIQGMLSNRDNE